MKSAWLPILSAAAMALTSLPASAQMVVSAKSGVVNFTEGKVLLNDKEVESSLTKYPDIKENAVLRTEAGRAEVLLTPGTILRMGENTGMKMITNRLIDTRVELQSGAAVVEAVQTAKDNNVTVVVKNGAAALAKSGIYRFDTEPARLKVYRGEAAVEINGQTIPVSTGRMLMLDGSSLTVEKFNADDTDALDHWSKQRGQLLAMANPSTAKSLLGSSGGYGSGTWYGGLGCTPYWGFNTWFGMYTYVPCNGYFRDPYGFMFWSPMTVGRIYYRPPANWAGYGGSRGFSPTYPTMGVGSGGYSSSMSSAVSSMGSGSMGSSMGASGSTAAASGGGSVGHGGGSAGGGGASGGGHGH
jgi:FecR protein